MVAEQEMASKVPVNYREASDPTRECDTCVLFHRGQRDLVRGVIEADHVCDKWDARAG